RLAIGDLDGDNDTDLVVTDPTGRRVGGYVRPLNPTTAWSGFLIGQYASATPTDVRVADVDGNGQLDVVVATRQPGSLRWFTPIGAKTDVWTENNLRDLSEAAGRIALGLVNPGSRIDVVAPLIAADVNADTVAWFENPEP
ncbi:MAG: FG-GAP repeat domain-containing protein, partial [Phycisphaerae bacterium]